MKEKTMTAREIQTQLFTRYPQLAPCKEDVLAAYQALLCCYQEGGKLLVCGNGGSAADAEHIVGELMKSFLFSRQIETTFQKTLIRLYGTEGKHLSEKLEGALPAIPLTSMPALNSAFANDVDSETVFSQMVYGYGVPGDVLLGISTSGNSKNVLYALMAGKAKGLKTIALTGGTGGGCKGLADIVICVPENETFQIQELHLPVYHTLCAMLEAELF